MCSVFYAGSLVDCFLLSRVSLPAFSQVMRVWIFFVSKFLSDSCGSILGDLLIHWTYSEASSVPGIVLGIGESKIKSRGPPSRAHGSSCQTERTICVDDCTGAPARAFSVGKRAGSLAELFRALRCFISLTQSFLSFLFYRSRASSSLLKYIWIFLGGSFPFRLLHIALGRSRILMKIVQILPTTTMEGCQYVMSALEAIDPRFHCAVKKSCDINFTLSKNHGCMTFARVDKWVTSYVMYVHFFPLKGHMVYAFKLK